MFVKWAPSPEINIVASTKGKELLANCPSEVPRLPVLGSFRDSRTLTTLWKQLYEEDQRIGDIVAVYKRIYNLQLAVLPGTLVLVLEAGMPSVQTSNFVGYSLWN